MRFHGLDLEDAKIVLKILRSLTPKWSYVFCSIGESKNLPKEKEEKSNFAELEEEETLLMAFHAIEEFDQQTWYVDTGCNNHMTGCKSFFTKLDESFHTIVMGKGDIQIRTMNDFIETISNVFYVPNLKTNLLSARQLQDKGYNITIFNGECKVYDSKKGSIVVVKMSANMLFPLKIKELHDCLLAKVDDSPWK
ncbi:hypothetical protein ES288_A01G250700v1 [Gossypium darwinii]|uniref:Retrovirus-related Pol polyprotein from transposon TNT 1-94-like beta-barrel domain-containing protein n=1 Tax=Gossypium darwinii TaxID=34276 RepID=A0A5D2HQL6_GOSDA|nr:hypothetical protein ES288_A01G250700v1 [Gossypium darwinii]